MNKLKILIINSRYFISAGPERYMFNLINILEKKGHKVIPFSVKHPKNEKTPYSQFFADPIGGEGKVYFEEYNLLNPKTLSEVMGRQFYSFHVKRRLKKLIKKEKPDVAYLLHHYNKLSPSVIDACKEEGVPVVMRLSDFSLVCPEGHLLRNKSPCEECIHKSLLASVKHKCVKNSFLASAVKACAMKFHRTIRIYQKVNYVISPSSFTIDKVKHLFKKNIIHIPTLTKLNKDFSKNPGQYALFVGRVEEEKGLMWAIQSFEATNKMLYIVGKSHSGYDKTLKEYVEHKGIKNVKFLGEKQGVELEDLYRQSRFLIMPNIWYENMPNVALEAMSHGKPILTSDLGSMREIVENEKNGLLVKPNDLNALREAIEYMFIRKKDCISMGAESYRMAKKIYSPDNHYKTLINIFEKAASEKR